MGGEGSGGREGLGKGRERREGEVRKGEGKEGMER